MTDAYQRPYRPVVLDGAQLKEFAFGPMIEQLHGERAAADGDRSALTLVHGEGLTVVLTVARPGTRCEPHDAAGPTMLLVLSGTIAVGAEGERHRVEKGGALAIGASVRHEIDAESDCAFLTIIGEQESGA